MSQMPVCMTIMLTMCFINLLLWGISMTSMKPEILTLVGYMFSFLLYLLVCWWTSHTMERTVNLFEVTCLISRWVLLPQHVTLTLCFTGFCIHITRLDISVLMYKEYFLLLILSLFFVIDESNTTIITSKVIITWFSQIISALNLFFHNNNAYLLINVPSKLVSLGPYTQSPEFTPLSKYLVKYDAWNLSKCILWFCLNHCSIIKFPSL